MNWQFDFFLCVNQGKGSGVTGGYRIKLSNLDFSIMVQDIEELFGEISSLQQVHFTHKMQW